MIQLRQLQTYYYTIENEFNEKFLEVEIFNTSDSNKNKYNFIIAKLLSLGNYILIYCGRNHGFTKFK
jgi:hypothetical protein